MERCKAVSRSNPPERSLKSDCRTDFSKLMSDCIGYCALIGGLLRETALRNYMPHQSYSLSFQYIGL
jgi:hypothetical protein